MRTRGQKLYNYDPERGMEEVTFIEESILPGCTGMSMEIRTTRKSFGPYPVGQKVRCSPDMYCDTEREAIAREIREHQEALPQMAESIKKDQEHLRQVGRNLHKMNLLLHEMALAGK